MEDLEIQAKELKEQITFEMTEAITRSLEQSYTLGQEDLKNQIIKTFKNQGILLPKKNITLAELIKNCDIRVTK